MFPLSSHRRGVLALAAFVATAGHVYAQKQAGDVQRGARTAQACIACHSFVPGQHLTGPSLSGVWGRKAGTAEGFGRYSDALRRSGITWSGREFDAWLANPAALVPGNAMRFPGVRDAQTRADLLAYLQVASTGKTQPAEPAQRLPDLKQAPPASRVTAILACEDGYRVSTADGRLQTFWEFNLRFKTDGSANGPKAGHPVIVPNGMRGDRASIVFAKIEEISSFVRRQCT